MTRHFNPAGAVLDALNDLLQGPHSAAARPSRRWRCRKTTRTQALVATLTTIF